MELLGFMYSGRLSPTSPALLVDVLIAADKFEVASCVRHCIKSLRSLPMTTESALLYLDLPSRVPMASAVQPLTDAAKAYLSDKYRDITRSQDELMSLPLAGIEAILSSDGLRVASEDALFVFVLNWAHARYPAMEERRRILETHLIHHIRFPYVSHHRLKEFLTRNDLDHELVAKLLIETLLCAEPKHKRFPERAYRYRRVKVVRFDRPHPQCIVYFDLRREECAELFPSGRISSQRFQLGGQGFFLSAHCYWDQQGSFHSFGLSVGTTKDSTSDGSTINYEFAARSGPSGDFLSRCRGSFTSTPGTTKGCRNLLGLPWTSFISDDIIFFIDDALHLRVELTIRQPSPPQ
ncbi:BACK [Musa troglodytarum]|uniref:BACK n=2 Tax=Musa troglodytarum TaxID=320322 RepID=A0A9E7F348_9LILI|nr:BACK [Musa troglodytarum]